MMLWEERRHYITKLRRSFKFERFKYYVGLILKKVELDTYQLADIHLALALAKRENLRANCIKKHEIVNFDEYLLEVDNRLEDGLKSVMKQQAHETHFWGLLDYNKDLLKDVKENTAYPEIFEDKEDDLDWVTIGELIRNIKGCEKTSIVSVYAEFICDSFGIEDTREFLRTPLKGLHTLRGCFINELKEEYKYLEVL
ncbi:MAG: hypothetical protein ACRCX8_20395 [Sarcina sp.]